MTTLVLSAAGASIGSGFAGALGISGAVLGRAAGAVLGRAIDTRLLGGSSSVATPRLERLPLTRAAEGLPIARVFGRMRVGGQVIWATRLIESSQTARSGKFSPKSETLSYTVSLALALGEGEISGLGRIWADGEEIAPASLTLRLYTGRADQLPDPRICAVEGAENTPAFRGTAYVVIEDLDLGAFGNRVPQFAFEVIRPSLREGEDLAGVVRAVALIPGTGEYALAPEPVRLLEGYGARKSTNEASPQGVSDLVASLDQLQAELPRVGSVSLVVSWFGDDLRAGHCTLRPKVEQKESDSPEMPWQAGGITRAEAQLLPRENGAPIYGGTPSDQSVIGAIREIHARGQEVMFYPFILMDQLWSNSLPDPWWGGAQQPAMPWRGRITSERGPYQSTKTDGTAAARAEVQRFFGAASAQHFAWQNGRLIYSGPDEWSLRRFILHYAHLCVAAGGVDAFCISSEMVGLTQIRDDLGFPAVEALCQLAADVRAILGPDVKISYAADWSEYHGYQPPGGHKLFHLDALWAHPAIDFIGIDTYMPLSDWRDGEAHLDAAWGDIHNLEYLRANIAGGEGFEWYYASDADRTAQNRTPITDWWGEDWIWRYKDLKGWWENAHFNRIGGSPAAQSTLWQPRMKPIRFTELGCAAIDKGTNAPNKFLDPKSSESGLPPFSDGRRDDLIQLQYLRAYAAHFAEPAHNPISPIYGAEMVDMAHAHVWTWDARPFPHFPARSDLWSDGENYARGHWLTGRAGSRSLASVVREICETAGLHKIDTSNLYGVVQGYMIEQGTGRAALQPLLLAHGIEVAQKGAVLQFFSRKGKAKATLLAGDLVQNSADEATSILTRAPEAEEVGRLVLDHIAAGSDFEAASVEALLPDEAGNALAHQELPMLLSRSAARDMAERWLAEARLARETLSFKLPLSQGALGAGDVVRLGGADWRIDRLTEGEALEVEASRVAAETWRPHPEEADVATPRAYAPPLPVEALFLDLPKWQASQSATAPHVAFTSTTWGSEVALYAGQPWEVPQLLLSATQRAVVGHLQGSFTGSTLEVQLVYGSLLSASAAEVEAGANLAAVGTGDLWELLSFESAVLQPSGGYRLEGIRRGLWGTQAVAPASWPQGTQFVLLDRRVKQVPLDASLRGVAQIYRWGPVQRPLEDSTWQSQTRAFAGVGLRPYAPGSLEVIAAGGDAAISWSRRARMGDADWGGTPLLPQGHSFRLRIRKGAAVLREVLTTASGFVYTSAQRAADGASLPYEVAVAEIALGYGAGPETVAAGV